MGDNLASPVPASADWPGNAKIATKDLGGGLHVVKVTPVDQSGNPAGDASAANQVTGNAAIGATNEAAAGTDTATSGLNGLLKRLLQRITRMFGTDTTVTPAAVALSASTSAVLLSANANRVRFIIGNPLATDLGVRKAASAASLTAGGYDFIVPAGTAYVSDPFEYLGELRGFCATAGSVNVSESV